MLDRLTVVGLYSDTSVTGVDASIFQTDGVDMGDKIISITRPYPMDLKNDILKALTPDGLMDYDFLKRVDGAITQHHIMTVHDLLERARKTFPKVEAIGFPGHTIYHNAHEKVSIQLGNADTMAAAFNVPVVNRFVQTDLKNGGTGGPVFASFFESLTRNMKKPVAVVTIGGISDVTWIGPLGELIAFDVGAGNVLLNAWMRKRMDAEMDFDGIWGAKGKVDARLLKRLMQHPFLTKHPPKTTDRNDFNDLIRQVEGMEVADGAATLTAYIAESITASAAFFPSRPEQWILTGGGTFNPTLVRMIRDRVNEPVVLADEVGWDRDMLESTAYGFLAARTMNGLPLTFPGTTGVREPLPGGTVHRVA